MKTTLSLACLMISMLACSNLLADVVTFDNRQNVDILQADNATISVTSALIGHYDSNLFWEGGTGGGQTIDMNFGQVRNVKTLRLWNQYALQSTNATIETSTDGSSWTPVTASLSNPDGGNEALITLQNAVDTQYLRFVNNTTTRIVEQFLRVYGDTGTLTDTGSHLDLISSSGYSSITQSISNVGAAFVAPGSILDDNPATFGQHVVWQLSTGDTVTISLGQLVQFGKFGFEPGLGYTDGSSTFEFKVYAGTDTSGALLLDQLGPEPTGLTYYTLAPGYSGTAITFQIVQGDGITDLRVNDFFLTGSVPEPASLGLLAAGGVTLLRRRRSASSPVV